MRLFIEYHSFDFDDIADSINKENSLNTKLRLAEEQTASNLKDYYSPQGEFENRKMHAERIKREQENEEKEIERFRKSTEQECKTLRQQREELKKYHINKLKKIKRLWRDYYTVKYNAEEEIANVRILSHQPNEHLSMRGYEDAAHFTFDGTASISIDIASEVISALRNFRQVDSVYITCSFKKNTGGQTTRDDFKYGWEICDLKIVDEVHNESFPIR